MDEISRSSVPAGYLALLERYQIHAIPNWHRSFVGSSGLPRLVTVGSSVEETFAAPYWPGESPGAHLEFALKYDGVNLPILAAIFEKLDPRDLSRHIEAKPTGKYARRLWYFYEFLTGQTLDLPDLYQGNYVDLLEPEKYYAVSRAPRVRRQRIRNNLPGNWNFCPIVRRTPRLREYELADLAERCRRVLADFSPAHLRRAMKYLYTRETRSSFEIERIEPSSSRIERFVATLQLAEHEDFVNAERLIALQHQLVDPRFRESGFRTTQNYVGESVSWHRERVHFIGAKPADLNDLMNGWMQSHRQMAAGEVPPVVHAAAIAYGFVFLHPFSDGNGRIHRLLIHNILAMREFTPAGMIFPVSAAMLHDERAYDESLESYSRPLMQMIDYVLNELGEMTVRNPTAVWYRYPDLTHQVESLYEFIERTIATDLIGELTFLTNYDKARRAILAIADLPDREIDLLLRFCSQNRGRLSKAKRERYFACLTDDEVRQMEQVIRAAFPSQ